ncbi:uncharacterized protein [Symphalangus syndactylus]|uniref:uncharacterized protein isoform X3 n=1 Tax=Symphalangus syndactylus TaxID=9590 RepID=UPI0030074372
MGDLQAFLTFSTVSLHNKAENKHRNYTSPTLPGVFPELLDQHRKQAVRCQKPWEPPHTLSGQPTSPNCPSLCFLTIQPL